MPRRKKGAVRRGAGAMCNICGLNCGKGGALKKHIEAAHEVSYEMYKKCFYHEACEMVADAWDDSFEAVDGTPMISHVLVRSFVKDPGRRGIRHLNP